MTPASSATWCSPNRVRQPVEQALPQIRQVMRSPDIIGLEEVDNLHDAAGHRRRINADTVASGAPRSGMPAYLETGNDIGGIDSGLPRQDVARGRARRHAVGKDTTYVTPANTSAKPLNDRPPLVLHAVVHKTPGDGGTPRHGHREPHAFAVWRQRCRGRRRGARQAARAQAENTREA